MFKNKKTNIYTLFCYSTALILVEIMILGLIFHNGNLIEYRLKLNLGLILTILFLSAVSVIFTSKDLVNIKNNIIENKKNLLSFSTGIIAFLIFVNRYLTKEILNMSILTVFIISLIFLIIGYILDKNIK